MTMLTAKDICVLVPTKDRPEEVRHFLGCLQKQSVHPGQIIIVDGGESVEHVVKEFPNLPVDYFVCHPPSQMRQKNLGISKIREEMKMVACFDDDVDIEADAFEKIIEFYNNNQQKYGGIAFNLTNRREFRFSFFKFIFCMAGFHPGRLLPSGYNTNLCNMKESMEVEWVFGGATLWKKEILTKYKRSDWYGSYAFTEDVEFSHRVRQDYPLAICAEAKFTDLGLENNYLYTVEFGRKQVLIRMELARRTEGFSPLLAFWACLGQSLEALIRIFINRKLGYLNTFIGNIIGLTETLLGKRYIAN